MDMSYSCLLNTSSRTLIQSFRVFKSNLEDVIRQMVEEEGEGLGWIRPLGELLTGGIHFREELVSLIKLTQRGGNLEKVFFLIFFFYNQVNPRKR